MTQDVKKEGSFKKKKRSFSKEGGSDDRRRSGGGDRRRSGGSNRGGRFGGGGGGGGRKNGRKKSTIDPTRLVKKAVMSEIIPYDPGCTFEDLPLHKKIQSNLKKMGFESPTKIQNESLHHLLEKKNLIGIAETGSGKTAAFLLPVIHEMLTRNSRFRVLTVVPTRELALQIEEQFKLFTKGTSLTVNCFIGGRNIRKDLSVSKRFTHLVVATPGRLNDLLKRGVLNLKEVEVLVLDEFDRMLDMGFIDDIKKIVKAIPRREQTLLFSATLDSKQNNIIEKFIDDPVIVKSSSGQTTADTVDQEVLFYEDHNKKFELLLELLYNEELSKVIVFEETKRSVSKICKALKQADIRSDEIHGNKSQAYRAKALERFEKGKIRVLVATDVAARGLDISDVSHVINYQLPNDYETYIHRIGRTGRAGKAGKAITMVERKSSKSRSSSSSEKSSSKDRSYSKDRSDSRDRSYSKDKSSSKEKSYSKDRFTSKDKSSSKEKSSYSKDRFTSKDKPASKGKSYDDRRPRSFKKKHEDKKRD